MRFFMSGISDQSYVPRELSHSHDQSNTSQATNQSKLLVGGTSYSVTVLSDKGSISEKLQSLSGVLKESILADLKCGEFIEENLHPLNVLNEFIINHDKNHLIDQQEQEVVLTENETNASKSYNIQIKEANIDGNNVDSKAKLSKNEQKEIGHTRMGGIHAKFKHFHVGDKNVGDIVQEKITKHLQENNKLTSKDVNRILNSVLQKAKYHDPETGEIKKLSKEQIEELKGLVHEYAAEALNLHNLTMEEQGKTEKEDVIIHDKNHSELAKTKTDDKRHPPLPIITFVIYKAGAGGEISRLTSILEKMATITRDIIKKNAEKKDAAADERKSENLREDIKKEELKRETLKHDIQNEQIINEQRTRGGTAFHPEVISEDSFSRNAGKIWP